MIGVFVTFRYGANFDERTVRKIAETGVIYDANSNAAREPEGDPQEV